MSRKKVGSSGGVQGWFQRWHLVDNNRPQQELIGYADSIKRHTEGLKPDGDWNIWVQPDLEYQYLRVNSVGELQKREPPKVSGIELEVRNAAANRLPLGDRHFPGERYLRKGWLSGTRFYAQGWWVEDAGHLAINTSAQESFFHSHRGKTELHPVHTFKSLDWSKDKLWAIVLADESGRFDSVRRTVSQRLFVPFRQAIKSRDLSIGSDWFTFDRITEDAIVDYVTPRDLPEVFGEPMLGPDAAWGTYIRPNLTKVSTSTSFEGVAINIYQPSRGTNPSSRLLGRMYAAKFKRSKGKVYFNTTGTKTTDDEGNRYIQWKVTIKDPPNIRYRELSLRRTTGARQIERDFIINYGPAAGFPAEEVELSLVGASVNKGVEPGLRKEKQRGLGSNEVRSFVSGRIILSPSPSYARQKIKGTKFRAPKKRLEPPLSSPYDETYHVLQSSMTVAKGWRISNSSFVTPLAKPTYVWEVRLGSQDWQKVDFGQSDGNVNLQDVSFKVFRSSIEIVMPDPPKDRDGDLLWNQLPERLVQVRLTLKTDIGENDITVSSFINRKPKSLNDPKILDLTAELFTRIVGWEGLPPGGGPIYQDEIEKILRKKTEAMISRLPARVRQGLTRISGGNATDKQALATWLQVTRVIRSATHRP